jgi:hypothetical protein
MTAVTKSGIAIRRRVAKGESNPAPLFPDDNNFFSKIIEVNTYKMPVWFLSNAEDL